MSISIPIFGGMSSLPISSNGKWRVTFKVASWVIAPDFSIGEEKIISGKKVKIIEVAENRTTDELEVVFTVSDSDSNSTEPTEAGWQGILIGVMILGGLSAIALTVTKVEKIIETPAGQVLAVGTMVIIAVIIFFGVTAFWKKIF